MRRRDCEGEFRRIKVAYLERLALIESCVVDWV